MEKLHDWFEKCKRDFPWRVDRSPYKVWISEVMLQQTRASVVIPYFDRWIELFPNVQVLAAADIETIIKAWEGLGYYSRARNLHLAAKEIVAKFGGQIPSFRGELETIPGLGSYTVGAILSFGFRQRAPAVDGNVARVVSRYFCIEENICRSSAKSKIHNLAENLLDQHEPWITAEALIELGAMVCSVRPRCETCPLREKCLAYRQNKVEMLPIKNEEKRIIPLQRAVVIIEFQGKVLLKKGEAGKVMADLYEFPYFEMRNERWSSKTIIRSVENNFGFKVGFVEMLPEAKHTFTCYKVSLYPIRLLAEEMREVESFSWVSVDRLKELPFSSGHRKILRVAF